MINMAITVAVNVVLNVFLIKSNTIIGAAIAALISGIVLFSLGLRLVGKIITYNKKLLLKTFGKTLLAAGAMSAILIVIKKFFDFSITVGHSPILENIGALITLAIYIVIGVLVYGFILVLLKGFVLSDFRLIFNKFVKKS